MDDELYREEILDHYRDSPYRGRVAVPDFSADGENPLCGDSVHLELKLGAQGEVCQVCFDGRGCAISQAAASMLAEEIEGRTLDEIRQFSKEDMLARIGVPLSAARRKCGLLGWHVLQHALADGKTKEGPA
jgi:nitrogen fixation NifU-like protein